MVDIKRLTMPEAMRVTKTLLLNWEKGNSNTIYNIRSNWRVQSLKYPTITNACIIVIYERMLATNDFVVGNIFELKPDPILVADALIRYINACYEEWTDILKDD
ncbi:hypothetical protein DXA92_07250 [Agathobaculum butyriciproducens]|nr:hypothetical protein DXA94_04045 [Agathobaculum butyriciproducens]RGC61083.1 hypothetical protein DXA92_07250 [Agathobaculum butyriciproducens]